MNPEPQRDTILIVDDSPTNIQLLGGAMMEHYDIMVATNGQEALDLAMSSSRPDLILLDVLMPGMDGYEVCRRLKADSWTRNIPVIFITAKSKEADEEQGLDLGAVDYITKPFSMPIVMARVRTHLELKRHRDMLESLSFRDGLTGIPNRRRFEQHLQRMWRMALREDKPLSVIMIDIDHFKAYNDTYGHQAGDDCLRKVARTLDEHMRRPVDLIARYGGEEFICILPFTETTGAVRVAETMRGAVAAREIRHENSSVAPYVTISLGIATFSPRFKDSPETLIGAADRALYVAKAASRNTCRAYDFKSSTVVSTS